MAGRPALRCWCDGADGLREMRVGRAVPTNGRRTTQNGRRGPPGRSVLQRRGGRKTMLTCVP
jgi:hypothetical protein